MLDTRDAAMNKTKYLLLCILNSDGVLNTGKTKQKQIKYSMLKADKYYEGK